MHIPWNLSNSVINHKPIHSSRSDIIIIRTHKRSYVQNINLVYFSMFSQDTRMACHPTWANTSIYSSTCQSRYLQHLETDIISLPHNSFLDSCMQSAEKNYQKNTEILMKFAHKFLCQASHYLKIMSSWNFLLSIVVLSITIIHCKNNYSIS